MTVRLLNLAKFVVERITICFVIHVVHNDKGYRKSKTKVLMTHFDLKTSPTLQTTRKPSLEVPPTTLAQKNSTNNQQIV